MKSLLLVNLVLLAISEIDRCLLYRALVTRLWSGEYRQPVPSSWGEEGRIGGLRKADEGERGREGREQWIRKVLVLRLFQTGISSSRVQLYIEIDTPKGKERSFTWPWPSFATGKYVDCNSITLYKNLVLR